MKKTIALILFVFSFFSACKGQNDSTYINQFIANESKYGEIVTFLKNNKKALLNDGCNPHSTGSVAFIALDDINRKKCYALFEDKLNKYFALRLFETIQVYADGDIELLVEFQPANNFIGIETSKYLLYTEEENLPEPYKTWKVKNRINRHWWFLEDVDAF